GTCGQQWPGGTDDGGQATSVGHPLLPRGGTVPFMRRTKIVATLGPASGSPEVIGSLIDAGMDVVRLGLAHGTAEEHLAAIALVRALARDRGRTVGVLADLPGPKVRTGAFPEGGTFLSEGDEVELSAGDGPSDAGRIVVDEDRLTDVVTPG